MNPESVAGKRLRKIQGCQQSRPWRDSHAFTINLTLSRTRKKCHAKIKNPPVHFLREQTNSCIICLPTTWSRQYSLIVDSLKTTHLILSCVWKGQREFRAGVGAHWCAFGDGSVATDSFTTNESRTWTTRTCSPKQEELVLWFFFF